MKIKTFILWILLLTTIDQLIKIIINLYFIKYRFDIVPHLFEFRPTFNSKYSYLNEVLYEKFGIDVGFLPHIVLYLILLVIIANVYISFKIKLNNSHIKIMNTAIIFLISACFSALISNIFWNKGVLDYIYLKPLFIFDLKDIYVNIGILLFLLYSIKNKEQMKNINLNPKDVIAYITKRFNPMN